MPHEKHAIAPDDPREGASGLMRVATVSTSSAAWDPGDGGSRDPLEEHLIVFETLVAGVAHELNNPMTYALAGVDMALRHLRASGTALDSPDAKAAEALDRALHGLNRIREIVRGLATFANGDVEKRSRIDVRSVVDAALQVTWHRIRHRARLEKHLAEVPAVEANAVRFGRLLMTLLVNAIEAIPEGQVDAHFIRVSTRAESDGNVVVEVADSGAGISTAALPHVFEPFFAKTGPGLGLCVAQAIVRDLGGTIAVQSRLGHGTTVRVELPRAYTAKSPAADAMGGPTQRSNVRGKVLIVDDDPLVGDAIARTLGGQHEVTVARSGREALERLADGGFFDVILCDLSMPVMTGMDLYEELARTRPEAASSMIFMTGGATSARARTFLDTATNACVQKPVDAKELRELVRSRTAASMHGAIRQP